MIKYLYETHLQVSHLERSVEFYNQLGLNIEWYSESRRRVHYTIGEPGEWQQMLGLQEIPAGDQVSTRHIAFGIDPNDVDQMILWLNERGISNNASFGRDGSEPVIHTKDPAASVYFQDPDGNRLELYARLQDPPMKMSYVPLLSEWRSIVSDKQGSQS